MIPSRPPTSLWYSSSKYDAAQSWPTTLFFTAINRDAVAIRSCGLGIMIAVSQGRLDVNQYVNPIALERIGFYYYVFYLGVLFLAVNVRSSN